MSGKVCFPFVLLVFLLLTSLFPGYSESSNSFHAPTPHLAVSNPTQNSIQVQWEAITVATRYELSYGTDEQAKNRGRIFVSTTNKTLTRLTGNTIYRVKVRAVVHGRAGKWSPIIEFSTQIPIMTDLEADDVRDTSVHLVWGDRYRDLPETYYEISYGTDPDATSDGQRSANGNFLTIRDLTLNTTYYVKLRVRNPKTSGPWSAPVSFTTLSYSLDMAPTGINLRSDKNSTIILNWNPIAGSESYDIAYGTDPIAENIGIIPTDSNYFKFNLSPNTNYYFKVRSVMHGTTGLWSKIKPFLTLPARPRGLNVLAQTSQQTIIVWQPPSGARIARYYHIQWGTDAQGTNRGITVTANTTYTLTNLKLNQTYAVRVRTLNAAGPSVWSKPLPFTTLPSGLKQVKVFSVKHTRAKIKWATVNNATGYEIAFGSDIEAQNKSVLEVKGPPALLEDLLPELTYYVKVRPLLPKRQVGTWSNIISFTTFPVPQQPHQPSVRKVCGTYVYLTWTAFEMISTYEILLSTDAVAMVGKNYTFQQPQARLRELKQNSIYYVKLRAMNLGGPGEWSKPVAFTTQPVESPDKLEADNILPTEVVIRWDAISGNAPTSYNIRYAAEDAKWTSFTGYTSQAINLTQLIPDQKYQVQVCGNNKSGLGPWSKAITFKTPLAPPAKAPDQLTALLVSDISATLQWKALPMVKGYQLSYGSNPDAGNLGAEDVKKTKYKLPGLMPDTGYYIKVKAYNDSGDGPWSDTILLTTNPAPPISPPSNVSILDTSENFISLLWDVTAPALRYEVSIGTDPKGINLGDPKSIFTPPYIFTELNPDTTYFVKVRSVNRGGGGPWSHIIKITTLSE
ncbi:fibronectin type III domain-containing protein [bacterium]|nr:fibronectin type III domain-containing protein [bacterium]